MKQQGLINAIILIVVALIILGYFNIDVKSAINTPAVQNNLAFAWQIVVWMYNQFVYVVNTFFGGYNGIKNSVMSFIDFVKTNSASTH